MTELFLRLPLALTVDPTSILISSNNDVILDNCLDTKKFIGFKYTIFIKNS